MARIPQSFIDTLLERTDIAHVVGQRVDLKKSGREFVACCPFHDEKTPSFTVVPAKQFYHCFGCGAHGTAISFLMEQDGLNFRDAVTTLADEAGLDMPDDSKQSGNTTSPTWPLYEVLKKADDHYRQSLSRHQSVIDYLKQQGISGTTAKRFGLGYAPADDADWVGQLNETASAIQAGILVRNENDNGVSSRFHHRLMLPIRDRNGHTVGFGSQGLDASQTEATDSPATAIFHKSNHLYGYYEARQASPGFTRLVVVPHYMDVLILAEHGFDNAVAPLDTPLARSHIQLLFQTVHDLVFCFEGSEDGMRRADATLNCCLPELTSDRRVGFVFLPYGEDPRSLVSSGPDDFEYWVSNAQNVSTWMLERLTGGIDTDSVEGRTQIIERSRPLFKKLPNDIYRDELILEIARLTGYPQETLSNIFARASRSAH